jgi:hypothetical protein
MVVIHKYTGPVTDCSGLAIEIGGEDVQQLGEITFYPHRLGQIDMREVLYAGYSLESIAEGKRPYVPAQEMVDTIIAQTSTSFADATGDRANSADQLQVENTLSRAAITLAVDPATVTVDPYISVAKKASCTQIPCFGNDTSCRLIDDWTGAIETDTLNGKHYYNLLPPSARPSGSGSKDRMTIDNLKPNEYLRYDADAWPSFCGQSATFSVWLETSTVHGGALLSR